MEVTSARTVWLVAALVCGLIGGFFLFVFYERYWQWRNCFNDLGRCWDPVSEQVFVEGAGFIWGSIAAFFLVIAGLCLLGVIKR